MTDKNNIAISVKDLKKSFKLPKEKFSGIKQRVIGIFKPNRSKGYEIQEVLKGLNFEIMKGEFFGIVGRNGSGKSTLLKTLAGIYTPDGGSVEVNGSLVPFIELGVGFNPELTGRENVFLNGALLGFSHDEMKSMYDDIVEFAELERFMDQKLKNYSSGMQVRLAFSIAIRADGDILLLDEVLAVGDEAFQRKCFKYFEELKRNKKTVILVTHSMDSVRKYCTKAMLIKDGRIEKYGNPDQIADEYYGLNLANTAKKSQEADSVNPELTARILGEQSLSPDDTIEVEINYKAVDKNAIFAKAYIECDGKAVMAANPVLMGHTNLITKDIKNHRVLYKLPLDRFNKGEYKIVALLEDVKTKVNIASYGYDDEMLFKINNKDHSSSGGMMKNVAKMELIK